MCQFVFASYYFGTDFRFRVISELNYIDTGPFIYCIYVYLFAPNDCLCQSVHANSFPTPLPHTFYRGGREERGSMASPGELSNLAGKKRRKNLYNLTGETQGNIATHTNPRQINKKTRVTMKTQMDIHTHTHTAWERQQTRTKQTAGLLFSLVMHGWHEGQARRGEVKWVEVRVWGKVMDWARPHLYSQQLYNNNNIQYTQFHYHAYYIPSHKGKDNWFYHNVCSLCITVLRENNH